MVMLVGIAYGSDVGPASASPRAESTVVRAAQSAGVFTATMDRFHDTYPGSEAKISYPATARGSSVTE